MTDYAATLESVITSLKSDLALADKKIIELGRELAAAEARGRKQAAHTLARWFDDMADRTLQPEHRCAFDAAAERARGYAAGQDTGHG